jgi:hypothetical protein
VDDRATALAAISGALEGLKADIERLISNSIVMTKKLQGGTVTLMVKTDGIMIKVEHNLILRGALFEPARLSLKKRVEDLFGMSVRAKNSGGCRDIRREDLRCPSTGSTPATCSI